MFAALRIPFMAIAVVALLAWLAIPQEKIDEARAQLEGVDIAALTSLSPAAGDADITLVSHKAVYTFRMAAVQSGAHVSDIRGKMYYEQDDACDAWTSDHRFTTEYYYPERPPHVTTSHYSAWEAKDGASFHFISERQENTKTTEQLRGVVLRAPDDGQTKAEYSRPEGLTFDLPKNYYLPMSHTHEVIKRARAGDVIFNATVFDGTDADGPVEINTIIGAKASAQEIADMVKAAGPQAKDFLIPEAWHIRMAVFPLVDNQDMLPSYEMDAVLHANGVISKTLVDYRTFKVAQTVEAVEALPAKSCP